MNLMDDQAEITRLKDEIEQLQKQLRAQQPEFTDLRGNYEFVSDLARYCEGIVTEQNVRKKWRLSENVWTELGEDEAFIEVIKRERERRTRNGATARERAQKLFTETPEVLGNILNDDEMSARHRIEAAREIRAVAATGPETQPPMERFSITINLGADQVLRVDQPIRPTPGTIEQESLPVIGDNNDEPV
jgi:hypothetical protein